MSWRCRRKLNKVVAVLEVAVPEAKANPVPDNLDGVHSLPLPSSDMRALLAVHKIVFHGNQGWLDEDSPSARILREIAGALVEWTEPRPAEGTGET